MTNQVQRSAIVTGGSRGIGAAIARRLAQDGIAVAINYASGKAAADELVAETTAAGGRAIAVQADLADPATPARLFDAAEQAFGGVDILVNNAGVMELGPLAEVTDEAFARQMSINLDSVFRSLREAARRLREDGRIVNFSSSVIGLYQPGYGVYAATKAAIEAMTHILAKELGGRRITVNAVAPGPVETRLFLGARASSRCAPSPP